MELGELQSFLLRHLPQEVIPFWIRHSVDWENGGMWTCLAEDWCLEWYWKCHDWAFAHFPDRQHGEWTQKLDRQGNKINDVIALPVKDPYHLPRGLIIAIDTLERLTR